MRPTLGSASRWPPSCEVIREIGKAVFDARRMTMNRTIRCVLTLGLAALAAGAASAATIPSPYRASASAATAGRLAAEGQQGLDLDLAALATLRNGTDRVIE